MSAASACGDVRVSFRNAFPGIWCSRMKTIDETKTVVIAIRTRRCPM